jgi:hypothetical protein
MSEMEEYLAAMRRYDAIQVDNIKQMLLEGASVARILKSSCNSEERILGYVAKLKQQNEIVLAEASRLQTILRDLFPEIGAIKKTIE